MTTRIPDTTLAARFTPTQHSHPASAIDPSNPQNALPPNQIVVIIGASRGIGAGIACAYAQAGAATLALCARASSAPQLASIAQSAASLNKHIKTVCYDVDITSDDSVSSLVGRIKEEIGRVDIVVLNSGYSGPVVLKVSEGKAQDFKDVFDVNVNGTYLVARHFVPLLLEGNGARLFIVVGSFATMITKGHIANTAYCVSKMAQQRLVEYVSEQYGEEGLISVGVHPGAVFTEMADSTTPDSFRPYLTDNVGLCGAFCVWLSKERKEWINGRLLSAKWDTADLEQKKKEVVDGDLLKLGLRL